MKPRLMWPTLRWPLAIWLLVTLLTLAANWVAFVGLLASRQQLAQMHTQRLQQHARIKAARQHDHFYTLYQQRAPHWRAIGLSTAADSVSWQETIYQSQQAAELPHVRYTLNSLLYDTSQHWPAPRLPAPLRLQIMPVQISSVGQHEAEALQWLQQLHQHHAESLLIRDCTWSLSDNQTAIESQCLLHWMHLPFDLAALKERS